MAAGLLLPARAFTRYGRSEANMRRNLRKVKILLEAFEAAGKEIDYYALDLSLTELERTLAAVPPFRNVKCHGLHGTYDDGFAWLKSIGIASRPKCIMSLGSSIGIAYRPWN